MELWQWIEKAPSPYHAQALLIEQLQSMDWGPNHRLQLEKMGHGGLLAWVLPHKPMRQFKFALAHTDSPTLRVKSKMQSRAAGFAQLNLEVYGGTLYNSWLDRDLGLAGMVAYEVQGKVVEKLVRLELGMRIPQLAIHLDRGVNQDGLKLNAQLHLSAIFGSEDLQFQELLLQHCPGADGVLAVDLLAYDQQKPCLGGMKDEYIYSARLDNLASCHAILEAVRQVELPTQQALGLGFFHHEEVGSETLEGARSMKMARSFEAICAGYGMDYAQTERVRDQSRALSLDMAHGLHPNYQDRHDPHHQPLCGKGAVLKSNANQRYATDLRSAAELRLLAKRHQLALQDFHARGDLGCGSTVGPGFASLLGVSTADVGAPMLSMHSAREMMAVSDHLQTISLIQKFFENQD